ncbi:hypothetical protein [Galbibacter sp. BG1]
MNERKNIIVSLKSNLGESKKGIEKRIEFLKITITLNLVFTIISVGIIILSIISELFDYEIFIWQKSGLMTILSLSLVINLPNQFFELKLLKHLKKINSEVEFEGIDKLNNELKSIVDKLNNGIKTSWSLIILVILIFIMGIWQIVSGNNPYWIFMKVPISLFYGMIILHFITTNRKLNKNINEAEKYCS